MSGRKSEVDHVFLGVVATLPEGPHPLTQSAEEFVRIQHVHPLGSGTCKNTTSRLAGQPGTLVLYVREDCRAIRVHGVQLRLRIERSNEKNESRQGKTESANNRCGGNSLILNRFSVPRVVPNRPDDKRLSKG